MKMQHYFFSCVLVSSSCAFAAMFQPNQVGSNVSLVTDYGAKFHSGTMSVSTLGARKKISYDKNMACDYQYLLEREANKEIYAREVLIKCLTRQIDQDLLGVDKNRWFRPLVSLYAGLCKASTLSVCGAVAELKKVESYVPTVCHAPTVYRNLVESNWYIAALVGKVVEHEVEQLRHVKGSMIDALLNERRTVHNFLQPMSDLIKEKVRVTYVREKGIGREDISAIPFDVEQEDIHYIELIGHLRYIDLSDNKVLISSDGKYVRAIYDKSGSKSLIWDIETGEQVTIKYDELVWDIKNTDYKQYDAECVVDRNNQYLVVQDMFCYGNEGAKLIVRAIEKKQKNNPVLVVFKRPTIASRVCQDGFVRNKGNAAELKELRDSKVCTSLAGFPGRNLRALIDKELKVLANK